MNQAQKSDVHQFKRPSEEYSVLQSICRNYVDENTTISVAGSWPVFRRVLKKVSRLDNNAPYNHSSGFSTITREIICIE